MKQTTKRALKFVGTILPFGLVASFLATLYTLQNLAPEMLETIQGQNSKGVVIALMTVQTLVINVIVLGILGYILADAVGLIKPFKWRKQSILLGIGIGSAVGILLALDPFTFGKFIPELSNTVAKECLTPLYLATGIFYGGVVEEIMLRLFMMSLIAYILWKVFAKGATKENIPTWVFVVANIVAALLFAAGHIPATISLFGELTPLLLIRCFLLNGLGGIGFGYVYRKEGIYYSMVAHAFAHIVSKLLLFILL